MNLEEYKKKESWIIYTSIYVGVSVTVLLVTVDFFFEFLPNHTILLVFITMVLISIYLIYWLKKQYPEIDKMWNEDRELDAKFKSLSLQKKKEVMSKAKVEDINIIN